MNVAQAKVTAVDSETGEAAITFNVAAETADLTPCTLVYPYSAANDEHTGIKDYSALFLNQDGTLNNNLDARVGQGTLLLSADKDLRVTVPLTPQYTVFKFSLNCGSDGIAARSLEIRDGDEELITTVLPSPVNSVLYAALPAAASGTAYHFIAFDSNKKYERTID